MEIVVSVFFIIPAVIAAVYHFILGTVGGLCVSPPRRQQTPKTRFAILIPAHNEELGIAHTLKNLQTSVDYPKELLDIYVIADNCTDATAEISRSGVRLTLENPYVPSESEKIAAEYGVKVIERFDDENRGKGFALSYAIPIILRETSCDGILIVDADCTLDSHSLRSFDERLSRTPDKPLQLNYVVNNPDESALSYLLAVAGCLENDFFYTPKDALRLFVMLRGTGMYLPRKVLERFPWEAFSIVEDLDYTLQLLKHDVTAGFIGEAKILSDFPVEASSLTVQRKRWIGGTLLMTLKQAFPLILKGLFTLRPHWIDAGITLLVVSRPLLIFQLFCTTVLTLLLCYPLQTEHNVPLLIAVGSCYGLYFLYFLYGVFGLGLTSARCKLAVVLPLQVLSYLFVAAKSLLGKRSKTWDRTPRT